MKKILLPTPDFPPARGGVARYLEAIKLTFPKEVEILYWKSGLPKRNQIVRELSELGSSYDEIWVSHIFPVGSVALEIFFRKRIPYTIFLHGLDFDLARRSLWRKTIAYFILKFAKTIVANSRGLAEEIEKFCGKKVMVVYPTIPDKLIGATQGQLKPVKHQEVTLLTVARLVERKGHLKILNVMKNIPNIKYLIVS